MFTLVQKVLDLVPDHVLDQVLEKIDTETDDEVIARLIKAGELPRSAMGIKAQHQLDLCKDGKVEIEAGRVEKLTKLVQLVQEAENRAGTANQQSA